MWAATQVDQVGAARSWCLDTDYVTKSSFKAWQGAKSQFDENRKISCSDESFGHRLSSVNWCLRLLGYCAPHSHPVTVMLPHLSGASMSAINVVCFLLMNLLMTQNCHSGNTKNILNNYPYLNSTTLAIFFDAIETELPPWNPISCH